MKIAPKMRNIDENENPNDNPKAGASVDLDTAHAKTGESGDAAPAKKQSSGQ